MLGSFFDLTIKHCRLWLYVTVWLQAKVRDFRLELQPKLYARSVCDDSAAEVAYADIVALCQ